MSKNSVLRELRVRRLTVVQEENTGLLVQAFTTYVRPLLEVNSQVWSPHLLKCRRHSTVRCCATSIYKKLVELHALTYTERLELLGLERLESRRIRADILFAYRLLFGLTALHSDDFFILSESTCRPTRGHPYKLFYRVVQLMSQVFVSATVS